MGKLPDECYIRSTTIQSIQLTHMDEPINEFFFVKHQRSLIKLSVHEIVFAKVEGRYTELHLPEKRFVCRKSLSELQEILPVQLFTRSHRNFLINKNFVQSVMFNESSVYLTTGEVLPVSNRHLASIRNLFPIVS